MEGKKELLEQIDILKEMTEENICRMPDGVLRSLAYAIKGIIGKEYVRGISREDVARYYGIGIRTLERWREKYPDFPVPRHHGDKSVTYDYEEVVRWKKKHLVAKS